MPRARRILKWAGLLLSILLTAAWVGTAFCYVVHSTTSTTIGIGYGGFGWSRLSQASLPASPPAGWQFGLVSPSDWLDYGLLPEWGTMGGRGFQVIIPLWMPLVVIAAATFIAWRRDRKLPPGHCRCGYNLTGNVSGRCPECGAEVEGAE